MSTLSCGFFCFLIKINYLVLVALGFCCCTKASFIAASRGTLCCGMQASRGSGFSCCRPLALGLQTSVFAVHGLRVVATGLVALRHVESSHIRDQTYVPCIGRWIPIYCATREVPQRYFQHRYWKSLEFSGGGSFLYSAR